MKELEIMVCQRWSSVVETFRDNFISSIACSSFDYHAGQNEKEGRDPGFVLVRFPIHYRGVPPSKASGRRLDLENVAMNGGDSQ